jgi:3-phosphoshikimate 1-carboxyvinyltransferase
MRMPTIEPIEIRVPGDKSISHRALILASLAMGRSSIRGILDSEDIRSTASVLRDLGMVVPELAPAMHVEGRGLNGLSAPQRTLDCGNSGTTARLMLGVLAGQSITAALDGDASLRSRPMRRVTAPLTEMGARVRELGAPDRLPVEIAGGALRGIEVVNERSSAQVKSAILLAALTARVRACVREPVHSRDHSERMLTAMGARLRTVVDRGAMCVEIEPVDELRPIDIDVPGDFSAAAFFLARGLLAPPVIRLDDVGVNATRTGFLDVVRRMGGSLHVSERRGSGGEPIANLIAESGPLQGAHIEAAEIPHMIDEIPIIAVLAARAHGETRIQGASELRVKETDRLHALASNLRAVGAIVEEQADGLVILGSNAPLRGRVVTGGDHRIAMAFGILGSLAGNDIEIDDRACVAISFPEFWQQLQRCSVS